MGNKTDHIIKVCLAAMNAQEKELMPNDSAEVAIRKYLLENPTAQIKLEDNKKLKPETLAELKAAAKKTASKTKKEDAGMEKD